MTDPEDHVIAIVGVGAILPGAPDARAFWANLVAGRSSIADVPKERWDPELYYDADPRAPDKTYSNIGHLRPAAGAAGLLKAALALHEKLIPASLGFEHPSPAIDWASSPFRVSTQARPWDVTSGGVRCAAVSAFGFGGTNFHVVLEEYVPGRVPGNAGISIAAGADLPGSERR